jgi:hypothetical protein
VERPALYRAFQNVHAQFAAAIEVIKHVSESKGVKAKSSFEVINSAPM